MTAWLKRTTNFASGINVGGGETTWDKTVQPTLLTKRVTPSSTSATAKLPAGTILLETWIVTDPDSIPTAGTVTMTATDTAGNVVTYLSGEAATATAKAAVSPIGSLSTDNTISITSASIDGNVDVGLLVLLPKWATSEAR